MVRIDASHTLIDVLSRFASSIQPMHNKAGLKLPGSTDWLVFPRIS